MLGVAERRSHDTFRFYVLAFCNGEVGGQQAPNLRLPDTAQGLSILRTCM